MKELKVKFADFWPGFKPEQSVFWNSILRSGYTPVISDEPDYLFYSMFGSENLVYSNCVRIFFTGENVVPDFNLCDYALGFEYLDFGDRYLRFPLYLFYENDLKLCLNKHKFENLNKTDFCSFVYSNSDADTMRIEIFDSLNKYKAVNSGGRYMNNIGEPNGVLDKLAFQSKHKFSIACENCSHPGYVTEKIVQCFAAQTIPIYWGDPRVKEEFNPASFINVSDFDTLDEVVERVKYLDDNLDEYLKVLKEPAIVEYDKDFQIEATQRLDFFLSNIWRQPYESAFRRCKVMWGKKRMDEAVKAHNNELFKNKYNIFVNSSIEGKIAYFVYSKRTGKRYIK